MLPYLLKYMKFITDFYIADKYKNSIDKVNDN